jgi:hypothetical protein
MQKLKTFAQMTGIFYIVLIVTTILMIAFQFAVLGSIISQMAEGGFVPR